MDKNSRASSARLVEAPVVSRRSRRDRQHRPHLKDSNEMADRPQMRVQQLIAELETMRTQITDLRLREAMARRRAEALQTEVERLNALLANGLLGRLMGFWRRTSSFG